MTWQDEDAFAGTGTEQAPRMTHSWAVLIIRSSLVTSSHHSLSPESSHFVQASIGAPRANGLFGKPWDPSGVHHLPLGHVQKRSKALLSTQLLASLTFQVGTQQLT